MSVRATTATSIPLSWSVPSGSVVTRHQVVWQRDTTGDCSNNDRGDTTIIDSSTATRSYTIEGLEEDSLYRVTVRAYNNAGRNEGNKTGITQQTGEIFQALRAILSMCTLFSSFCSPWVCVWISTHINQSYYSLGSDRLHPQERGHNRLLCVVQRCKQRT